MADGVDIRIDRRGRVVVVLHERCPIARDRILVLLAEAGVDVAEVMFLTPEEACLRDDLEDAAIVIPVSADVCDAPELEAAGSACGAQGGRVVVVFDNGFAYEGLHPIADRYGTQCGWSPDALRERLSPEADDAPSDGTGRPVRRPRGSQVKC
jgi:hypothetical protein